MIPHNQKFVFVRNQTYVQSAKSPRRGKVNMLIDVVPYEKEVVSTILYMCLWEPIN